MYRKNIILIKKYFKVLFSFKKLILAASFLIILSSIIIIIPPKIMMSIIDVAIKYKDMTFFLQLMIAFLLVIIIQHMLKILSDYVCNKLGKKVVFDLKSKLVRHILKLNGKYYSKINVGEVLTVMDSDILAIEAASTNIMFSLISDSISALIMLVFLLQLKWDLVIIIIGIQLLFIIFQILYCRKVIKSKREHRTVVGEMTNLEEEIVSNLKNIVLLNASRFVITKFDEVNKKLFKKSINQEFTVSMSTNITSLSVGITTFAVFAYGGYMVINGVMELGALIAFNMYSQKMFTPVIRGIQANILIQQVLISLERVFKILDEPINYGEGLTDIKDSDISNIQFKDIYFCYDDNHTIIESLNLDVKRGESIAIIGESGIGKSTIMYLLSRLWDPVQGNISINNNCISQFNVGSLRENIAIVSQDTVIFNDTIYNNLVMGNKDILFSEVERCCKSAEIHDFICSLPHGYKTFVGNKGASLSGGQKQRIAIARAIIANTPIIILDESTSALDKELQEKVFINLKMYLKNKISIIITHRLEILEFIDEIYKFENKSIYNYKDYTKY